MSCVSQLISSFIFIKKIRNMQGVMEQIASNVKINTDYNPFQIKIRSNLENLLKGNFKKKLPSSAPATFDYIPFQMKIRSNLENILKGNFKKRLLSSALAPIDVQEVPTRSITPYGNNLHDPLKKKKSAEADTATSEDYEVSELANKPKISVKKFVVKSANDEPITDTEIPTFVALDIAPNVENKVKELNKHIKNDHCYASLKKKTKKQSINRTGRVKGNLRKSVINKIMNDVCRAIQADDVNANCVSRKWGRRVCNWKGGEIIRMRNDEVKYFQDMITYLKDPEKKTMEISELKTINIDQLGSIETSVEPNNLWMYHDGATVFERSIMHQLNLDAPTKSQKKPKNQPPANKTTLLSRKIECFICNEVFTSEKAIKKHSRDTGHPPLLPKFQCKECQLWFSGSKSYKLHRNDHHGEGLNEKCVCEVCGMEIRSRSNMKRHMLIHSKVKPFVCETCGLSYNQAYQLKLHHKKKHEGVKDEEKSVICYICGTIIGKGTSGGLSTHIKKYHSELASHPCDICDQKFLSEFALRMHKLKHLQKNRQSFDDKNPEDLTLTKNGKKCVTCEICEKSVSKMGLKKHMDIHLNIKRHKCDVCNKKFRQMTHVQRHMRLHLDLKPYECDICGKKFRHSTSKVIHRRSHTGETPYVCRFCNKGFAHSSTMKKHEQTHFKESLELTEVQEVPLKESYGYISESEESDDEN